MQRRTALAATVTVTALAGFAAPPVRAQGSGPVRSIGLFSLVGDAIEVTAVDNPTDTRIDRTGRTAVEVKDIGFDAVIADAVRRAAQGRQPELPVRSYRISAALPTADQMAIAAGARSGELPTWMVATIRANPPSHLLIVTRSRAEASFSVVEGHAIGRSNVTGMGFYIDSLYTITNAATGNTSVGALGAHAVLTFTLMEVSSAQARSEPVQVQQLVPPTADLAAIDPWQYIDAAGKVRLLRDLARRAAEGAMKRILA